MVDIEAARNALEEARKVQASVADKVRCPPSRHVAMGVVMGAMIAAQAAPPPISLIVLALCLAGVALLVADARKRLGFFVNGYRRGRTLWVAISLLVFVEATLALCVWLKDARHLAWAPIAGGVAAGVVAAFGSYVWQSVYRAEARDAGGALTS